MYFVALPCVHAVVYTSGGETETEPNRDSIFLIPPQDMELSLSYLFLKETETLAREGA